MVNITCKKTFLHCHCEHADVSIHTGALVE